MRIAHSVFVASLFALILPLLQAADYQQTVLSVPPREKRVAIIGMLLVYSRSQVLTYL